MVYIFLTHAENCEDDFFDPDTAEWGSGENAVIIRPLEDIESNENCIEGPVIFDEKNERFEYIPILREGTDPDFLTDNEYRKLNDVEKNEYFILNRYR